MKKNRIFGLASAIALLAVGACSNDIIDPNKNQGEHLIVGDGSGGVYMSVDFKMPTGLEGTRSSTGEGGVSTGGTEIGSPAENFVSSALIVLASTEEKKDDKGNVLLSKYGFIVAGEVPGNRIQSYTDNVEGITNKQYKATARLQKANLEDFYNLYSQTDNTGAVTYNLPEVYVFVFCNPTKDLLDRFDPDNTSFGSALWMNETCEVTQTKNAADNHNIGIWGSNSFLMNNVKLASRELPKNLLDWEYYTSTQNAFKLSGDNSDVAGPDPEDRVNNLSTDEHPNRGSVLVERSVARFDFKDGSPKGKNTYPVLFNLNSAGDFDTKQPIVDIVLEKMCLVNMCNNFYYLPRVSNDGMPEGEDFQLCGYEKPWSRNGGNYSGGNYVVGPYADAFGGDALASGFDTYMNFPFFENNGSFNNEQMSSDRWDVIKIDDVLNQNAVDDNYDGTGNTEDKKDSEGNPIEYNKGGYKVWRYVTENVIPKNQDKQVNGISTGVVFKGRLKGGMVDGNYVEEAWNAGHIANLNACLNGEEFTYNGTPHTLTGSSQADPILYYFAGRLYMGWRHIRQAAIQAAITINAAGEMEINTSNSLYKAVFGDGPIPSSYRDYDEHGNPITRKILYMTSKTEGVQVKDPRWKNIEEAAAAYEAAILKASEDKELNKVIDAEGKFITNDITDNDLLGYIQSANFAWSQWAYDGKEVGSDATGDKSKEHLLLVAMREAVTGNGITIYQSSLDNPEDKKSAGYYCYYYYWNRHNDNGLNGSMGPMEFAVVRNNVYKLSVDKINRLGHPRIPENDPDSPTPETPDESDEIYLAVRVQIAPWVVRLNSIQF